MKAGTNVEHLIMPILTNKLYPVNPRKPLGIVFSVNLYFIFFMWKRKKMQFYLKKSFTNKLSKTQLLSTVSMVRAAASPFLFPLTLISCWIDTVRHQGGPSIIFCMQ